MKKVLAWVLALALVLSTFAMSFATYTDEAAQKEANCEGQVAALSALQIVKGYPDGEYKPANVVTRAEMAAFVIRAMGFSDVQETGYETGFSDVPKEAWCSGVVKQAADLGLIEGYPDGTFKPNEPVTYNEALTMIVRAFGYKDAYLVGSWPQNFVNQAKTLGLYEGVGVTEENFQKGATRGDCAIMIYNALYVPMITYDKDGKHTLLVTSDNFINRLEKKLGVKIVLEEEIIVEMCDIAKSDVLGEELLGAPITAMTFDGVVASIFSVNATLYDVADLEGYTPDNDTDWNFVNGYVEVEKKSDDWKPVRIAKNQIKNADAVWANVDGKHYDVESALTWDARKTIKWTKDDVKKLANGDFDKYYILDKNDAIDVDHFFLKGTESLEKIAVDNIVTFYFATPTYGFVPVHIAYDATAKGSSGTKNKMQPEKVVSKVEVGKATVAGKVDKVNRDAKVATINGTDYEIAEGGYCLYRFGEKNVLAGENGVAYLNYQGDIAFWEKDSETKLYGITTKKTSTDYRENSQFKTAYTLDMFTQDGEAVTLDVVKGSAAQTAVEGIRFKKDGLAAYTLSDEDISTLKYAEYFIEREQKPVVPTKTVDGQLIQGKYDKNGNDSYKNCARFVLSDDVIVFSKDSYGPNADWTVSGYDSIENFKFDDNAGLQWIVEGDEVVALAYSQCLTDQNPTFAFITKAELIKTDVSVPEGYYEVSFINLDTKNTVTMEAGRDTFIGGNLDVYVNDKENRKTLVYITFDGDKIKTIEKASTIKGIGKELSDGQAVKIDIYGASIVGNYVKVDGEQQYRIAENALVYKWDGKELSPISLGGIYGNSKFVLYQTVSGAWSVDIVIWEYK